MSLPMFMRRASAAPRHRGRARRRLLSGALLIAGLPGAVLLAACLMYPPAYVFRLVRWGEADAADYRRFPARDVHASENPYYFRPGPDESRIRSLFAQAGQANLDTFLAETGTQAFLVIQDDTILYERYFNGAARDSVVTSFSMAKSFTSALIGIAIADGHIASVGDPITNYLPELAARDRRFAAITIRDLLRMSSGIRYKEFPFVNGDDAKTYYYPDLRHLALHDTAIVDAPGKAFLYNNYHPLLLGMILERATGTPVATYLQDKIWKPIGMEFDASWSLDSATSGFEKMESGINGRAIDFAKFGRLFLNDGNWNGRQVIPTAWVAESTRPNVTAESADYYPNMLEFAGGRQYYGYMWWGRRRGTESYNFAARGNHGQFIYVAPAKKLIIVRHGDRFGTSGAQWMELFYKVAGTIALPRQLRD